MEKKFPAEQLEQKPEEGGSKMENILCVLRQINACLGLYESEKLAKSGMTFAQVFLLN